MGQPERTDAGRVDDPAAAGQLRTTADVEVCRPRPVTALTCAGGPHRAGHERVDQRRLADAGVPDQHRASGRGSRSTSSLEVAAAPWRPTCGTSSAAYAASSSSGLARSVLVTHQQRVQARVVRRDQAAVDEAGARARGRRPTVTIASWSAFATMTRSTGSSSSAVRRSTDRRGSTLTMRASASSPPARSPTSATRSPTTTPLRPSSRAFTAMTSVRTPSRSDQAAEPAAVDGRRPAVTASACAGRSLVRGRDLPRPGRTRTSSSSSSRRLRGVSAHRPSIPASRSVKPGSVLPVVATSTTRTSGTARPEHGGGGGDPVVVVRPNDAAVQRRRAGCRGRRRSPRRAPPSAVSSAAIAASRSVSCPRRWATPRRVVRPGRPARPARRRPARARRPRSGHLARCPQAARPVDHQRAALGVDLEAGAQSRSAARAARPPAAGSSPPGTRPPPPARRSRGPLRRTAAALDRSGSIVTAPPRGRVGPTDQPRPSTSVPTATPRAQRASPAVISHVRQRRHGAPDRASRAAPRRSAQPASSRPLTNWLDALASTSRRRRGARRDRAP